MATRRTREAIARCGETRWTFRHGRSGKLSKWEWEVGVKTGGRESHPAEAGRSERYLVRYEGGQGMLCASSDRNVSCRCFEDVQPLQKVSGRR